MDLFRASIQELRARLLAGELTVEALVRAHMERIAAFEPRVRAFTWTRFEAALEEARTQDRELEARRRAGTETLLPPLFGMPCSVKNCFAFAGAPWVGGAVHRRETRASQTAPAVTRLREAGAIVLGLTNVPEALTWFETDNHVHGRTENPRKLGTSPGGSSGGEAAVLAYGGVVFGLGTDMGSSIRLPAALCGIAGLKPSPRRIEGEGVWPSPEGKLIDYSVVGPMARNAEDLATVFAVLARGGYESEGAQPSEGTRRLRFLVAEGPSEFRIEPAIEGALQAAAQALELRGFQTERFTHPGLQRGSRLWFARMGIAQGAPGMKSFREIFRDGESVSLSSEWWRILTGKPRHTVPVLALATFESVMRRFQGVFAKDLQLADDLERALAARLGDDGVLLLPAFARTRMRHHEAKLRPFHFGQGGVFNVLELPAVVVPVGVSETGAPLALQVVAPRGCDERALRAAREIEKRLPPASVAVGPKGWDTDGKGGEP